MDCGKQKIKKKYSRASHNLFCRFMSVLQLSTADKLLLADVLITECCSDRELHKYLPRTELGFANQNISHGLVVISI